MTNYALLTYGALSVIPPLISHSLAAQFAIWLCLALAPLAGLWAWLILDSLDAALDKERRRMNAARSKLLLVQEMHAPVEAAGDPRKGDPEKPWTRLLAVLGRCFHTSDIAAGRATPVLQGAVIAGAVFAFLINLSQLS